ncbi:OB-fold protein [Seonamhaeicola maritimus]|uniref:tRNA_anti-like n=1 Tax=Seonamhaeicola maritimus TaxID=2591822 RepID=A0A5C7GLW5_9FLAO|nr:hypothetical protein [Seonamhaeicola maritimus]TXG39333.1 hypothetical protein FUA22_05505 [Seonamhaeicola maritimus]
MKKKLIIVLLIGVIGVVLYNYIYKDHRNISTEKAEFTITSIELSNDFQIAPSDSEKKYLNKTIVVSGTISEVNDNNLVLNQNIFCQLQDPINQSLQIGNSLKVKGRCIGYDDLLEEIKLDQCTIYN